MSSASGFVAQFFPIFLLGALFGKLMESSGAVEALAQGMITRLGTGHAMLAIVLAGAMVTYGGVSLFVAFFVLAPMGHALFKAANIPHRLMPAAIALGTSTFTMTAMPGTPAIQNAIPMPFFDTNTFAAPGLGLIAALVMLSCGLAWLSWAQRRARLAGEIYDFSVADPKSDGAQTTADNAAKSDLVRERVVVAREFDPGEIARGQHTSHLPSIWVAATPLITVVVVNLTMSFMVLPRLNAEYLSQPQWGSTTLGAVSGVWSVITALAAAIVVLLCSSWRRLPSLRVTMDAGVNAAVLPMLSVASLVGFGAVIAALPGFEMVKQWVLSIEGGPLVSLAVATNILAALTGSASGGLTIALDALARTYMQLAHTSGIDPALMHRVAVIGAGTLDSLPHNGAVVSLLAVCGARHKGSYGDIVMAAVVGPLIALAVVIALGSVFGAF
jgi:H+/gluconate symporter-like permease